MIQLPVNGLQNHGQVQNAFQEVLHVDALVRLMDAAMSGGKPLRRTGDGHVSADGESIFQRTGIGAAVAGVDIVDLGNVPGLTQLTIGIYHQFDGGIIFADQKPGAVAEEVGCPADLGALGRNVAMDGLDRESGLEGANAGELELTVLYGDDGTDHGEVAERLVPAVDAKIERFDIAENGTHLLQNGQIMFAQRGALEEHLCRDPAAVDRADRHSGVGGNALGGKQKLSVIVLA